MEAGHKGWQEAGCRTPARRREFSMNNTPTPTFKQSLLARTAPLGLIAGLACVVLGGLGGCSPGARERNMAARDAVVISAEGSKAVAYFSVQEDRPRLSAGDPITTTASSEWMHGR